MTGLIDHIEDLREVGVERTLRSMAKEYAGAFYAMNERSPKFRAAYPSVRAYLRGRQLLPNGKVQLERPNWLHFVQLARQSMVHMLGLPDGQVSPAMKAAIFEALVEDREKQLKEDAAGTKRATVPQRMVLENVDRQGILGK